MRTAATQAAVVFAQTAVQKTAMPMVINVAMKSASMVVLSRAHVRVQEIASTAAMRMEAAIYQRIAQTVQMKMVRASAQRSARTDAMKKAKHVHAQQTALADVTKMAINAPAQ